MRTPPIFKPLVKTVVTEVKHFIVDSVRRVAQGNHTVATKVTDATMTQTEVVVGPGNPYTLKDVSNLVSIQCPFEIMAEFTSFGFMPEPETRTEQVFFDATLEVIGATQAGRFISVRVTDMDIYTPAPLAADVMNMRTGEVENITLHMESQGVYSGFFQTQNNDATGTDFDDVMYCRKGDTLRVSYAEPAAANGLSREITTDVTVTLDFAETVIEMPDTAPFDSFLNLRIRNPASSLITMMNLRTQTVIAVAVGNFTPIKLGYDDGDNAFAVQEGDQILVDVLGKDIYGQIKAVTKTLTIAVTPAQPELTAPAIADTALPFTVELRDDNLPANVTLKFTNATTGISSLIPMVSQYEYSGRFSLTLPTLHNIALPGQPVTLTYENMGLTVTKNIDTIMAPTPGCDPIAPDVPTQSAPVVFKINGMFFLNGSFAGTIKLYADKPVRCTLIKA